MALASCFPPLPLRLGSQSVAAMVACLPHPGPVAAMMASLPHPGPVAAMMASLPHPGPVAAMAASLPHPGPRTAAQSLHYPVCPATRSAAALFAYPAVHVIIICLVCRNF